MDRLTVLKKIEDKYNYEGVSYPATFDDIGQFEKNNHIAIFVYYIDETGSIRTEKEGMYQYLSNDIVYLLRIENDEKSHYVYVKHVERLLNLHHQAVDKDKRFCPMCEGKIKLCDYTKHLKDCVVC